MTILCQDTFVRSNTAGNTTVGNVAGWGTSSDGNAWAGHSTAYTYSIASNTGKITGSTVDDFMTLTSTSYTTVEVLTSFTINAVGSSDAYGAVLRYNAGTNQGYIGWIAAGNNTARISNYNNGSYGDLATANITFVANTKYWVRFQAIGSALKMRFWQDGTSEPSSWTVSASDSTYTTNLAGVFYSPSATTTVINYSSVQINDTNPVVTNTWAPIDTPLSATDSLAFSNAQNVNVNLFAVQAITGPYMYVVYAVTNTANISDTPLATSESLSLTQTFLFPETISEVETVSGNITQLSTDILLSNESVSSSFTTNLSDTSLSNDLLLVTSAVTVIDITVSSESSLFTPTVKSIETLVNGESIVSSQIVLITDVATQTDMSILVGVFQPVDGNLHSENVQISVLKFIAEQSAVLEVEQATLTTFLTEIVFSVDTSILSQLLSQTDIFTSNESQITTSLYTIQDTQIVTEVLVIGEIIALVDANSHIENIFSTFMNTTTEQASLIEISVTNTIFVPNDYTQNTDTTFETIFYQWTNITLIQDSIVGTSGGQYNLLPDQLLSFDAFTNSIAFSSSEITTEAENITTTLFANTLEISTITENQNILLSSLKIELIIENELIQEALLFSSADTSTLVDVSSLNVFPGTFIIGTDQLTVVEIFQISTTLSSLEINSESEVSLYTTVKISTDAVSSSELSSIFSQSLFNDMLIEQDISTVSIGTYYVESSVNSDINTLTIQPLFSDNLSSTEIDKVSLNVAQFELLQEYELSLCTQSFSQTETVPTNEYTLINEICMSLDSIVITDTQAAYQGPSLVDISIIVQDTASISYVVKQIDTFSIAEYTHIEENIYTFDRLFEIGSLLGVTTPITHEAQVTFTLRNGITKCRIRDGKITFSSRDGIVESHIH